MGDFLSVLAIAALPFAGTACGALVAARVRVSDLVYTASLHLAAGIVLAVVGVELMPRAVRGEPAWIVLLAFVGGGAFSILADRLIERWLRGRSSGPWMIFTAVSFDLFTDGVMIGTGATISPELGLMLALAQFSGNFPEGFVTIASFKSQGAFRRNRSWISAAFAIPVFVGTTCGFWLVRGRPEILKLSLLSFTAAILVRVAVGEMVTHAHLRAKDTYIQEMAFIAGFALFTGIAVYLG